MDSNGNQGNGIIYVNGVQALMFHYVRDYVTARKIMESRILIPSLDDDGSLVSKARSAYYKLHVNLTSARPEEGREVVAAATGLVGPDINYCLELLVNREGLVKAFEQLPRAFQIISEYPVPVNVRVLRSMARIDKGHRIHRFTGPNGLPYGFYVPKERSKQRNL